jgi:hypothetical protein
MDNILPLVWKSMHVNISYNLFLDTFKEWEQYPIYVQDNLAGGWLVKDHEIHTGILPEFQRRVNWKKYCKLYINPLLESRGYLTTTIPKYNRNIIPLLVRGGMYYVKEDEHFFYLRMEKLNYV